MKRSLGLILALLGGAACALAQTNAADPPPPGTIRIIGEEAVRIQQTIDGYVQGAMNRNRLEVFDRNKGKNVILRLDRIVLDDPARAVFVKTNELAVCGECTEIASAESGKSEIQEKGEGDKYEVWFLLQRRHSYPSFSKVINLFIKSVNGNPMYTWTQDPGGNWSATLAPEPQ
jgi:hypothetical protein